MYTNKRCIVEFPPAPTVMFDSIKVFSVIYLSCNYKIDILNWIVTSLSLIREVNNVVCRVPTSFVWIFIFTQIYLLVALHIFSHDSNSSHYYSYTKDSVTSFFTIPSVR